MVTNIPPGGYPDAIRRLINTVADLSKDEIAKRLARIAGHAASLKRMWDEGTECEEILTQISAVRAGLDQAGKVILQHHIDHCVKEALATGKAEDAIRELHKALDRFL